MKQNLIYFDPEDRRDAANRARLEADRLSREEKAEEQRRLEAEEKKIRIDRAIAIFIHEISHVELWENTQSRSGVERFQLGIFMEELGLDPNDVNDFYGCLHRNKRIIHLLELTCVRLETRFQQQIRGREINITYQNRCLNGQNILFLCLDLSSVEEMEAKKEKHQIAERVMAILSAHEDEISQGLERALARKAMVLDKSRAFFEVVLSLNDIFPVNLLEQFYELNGRVTRECLKAHIESILDNEPLGLHLARQYTGVSPMLTLISSQTYAKGEGRWFVEVNSDLEITVSLRNTA